MDAAESAPASAPASHLLPPRPLPTPPAAPVPVPSHELETVATAKETVDQHRPHTMCLKNGSESDVESNDGAGVGKSWVITAQSDDCVFGDTIRACLFSESITLPISSTAGKITIWIFFLLSLYANP